MRKLWCVIGLMAFALSACSTQQEKLRLVPAQPAYTVPVVEISGTEARYEPYNPGNMQDYEVNGKRYSIASLKTRKTLAKRASPPGSTAKAAAIPAPPAASHSTPTRWPPPTRHYPATCG